MAGLFIGWGAGYPGRENKGAQVFSEALGFYARLVEEGRIESFEPFLLGFTGRGLDGFMILRGSEDQLNALRADDEFTGRLLRAGMVVKDLFVSDLYFGESLKHLMDIYERQVGALA